MIEFINLYKKDSFGFFKKFEIFFKEFEEYFVLEEILPDHFKKAFFNKKNKLLKEAIEDDIDFNYFEIFKKQTILFESLQKSKIDGLLLLAYKEIESNETILKNLNSFRPKKSYSDLVVYNRVETITGRLTVKSGPKILTIPSRCRNIIKSRFENGKIINIDFKSLEPRIVSYISGNKFCEDIYQEINNFLSFNADRSVIKRAVISLIYGSSIKRIDNLSNEKSLEISNVINKYFDFKKIVSISKKIDKKGYRRNYFGRPIHNLKEENERKILNNFIQSTAVDIALNYFSDIVLQTCNKSAIPLFIIHDAIIFDVKNEYENKFTDIIKNNCKNSLGIFPLEITEINRRKF